MSKEIKDPLADALERAKGLLRRSDFAGAEAAFAEALGFDPESEPALLGLAKVHLAQGKKPEVVAVCERVAAVYAKSGRDEKAIEVYLRILALDSGRASTRIEVAGLLYRRGQIAEAVDAVFFTAEQMESAARHDELEQCLRWLRVHVPDDERYPIGVALVEVLVLSPGREEAALRELRAVLAFLEIGGTSEKIPFRPLLARLGGYATQTEILGRIVALDPEDGGAAVKLGRFLLDAESHDAAIGAVRPVLARNPRSVPALVITLAALEGAGRTEEAQAVFGKLREIEPAVLGDRANLDSSAELDMALREVETYLRYGLPDKALDTARRAAKRNPASLGAWLALQGVCEQTHDSEGAVRATLTAFDLCLARGEAARAREILDAGLRLAPSDPELLRRLALAQTPGRGRMPE